jgi:hypothetical protein
VSSPPRLAKGGASWHHFLTVDRQITIILDAVGRVRAARVIPNTGYSIARDAIPASSKQETVQVLNRGSSARAG